MSNALPDFPPTPSPALSGKPSENGREEKPQQEQSPPIRRRFAPLAWFVHRAPTVAVFVLLGGLGWYGHHSDWKLPKFSTLAGAALTTRDDWCAEHSVPESQCVICDP